MQNDLLVSGELSESKSSPNRSQLTWVEWYSSLEGHDFLLVVDRDFLMDKFNFVGLADYGFKMSCVPDALRLLLS